MNEEMSPKDRVFRLSKRQKYLDDKVRTKGFKLEVYDSRKYQLLQDMEPGEKDYSEVWHTDYTTVRPELVKDPNKLLVSVRFPVGISGYYVCGERESNEEFAVTRVAEGDLERVINKLEERGAEEIIIGRELDKRETLLLADSLKITVITDAVKSFYEMPKNQQEERLRELLSKEKNKGGQKYND